MAPSLKLTGYFKEGLIVLGLMAAIVVALPLLAVAVLSVRFLFLGVLAAAAVLLVVSPALRRYASPARAALPGGLALPDGVMVARGHAWARVDGSRIRTGADDLLQKVFGPVEAVELPAVGARVEAGAPLVTLRRGGRSLALRAPASGVVRAVNEGLASDPGSINRSPFGEGWAVELEAAERPTDLRGGNDAIRWLRTELDRLVSLAAPVPTAATATALDGGTVSAEFLRNLDDAAFGRIARELF